MRIITIPSRFYYSGVERMPSVLRWVNDRLFIATHVVHNLSMFAAFEVKDDGEWLRVKVNNRINTRSGRYGHVTNLGGCEYGNLVSYRGTDSLLHTVGYPRRRDRMRLRRDGNAVLYCGKAEIDKEDGWIMIADHNSSFGRYYGVSHRLICTSVWEDLGRPGRGPLAVTTESPKCVPSYDVFMKERTGCQAPTLDLPGDYLSSQLVVINDDEAILMTTGRTFRRFTRQQEGKQYSVLHSDIKFCEDSSPEYGLWETVDCDISPDGRLLAVAAVDSGGFKNGEYVNFRVEARAIDHYLNSWHNSRLLIFDPDTMQLKTEFNFPCNLVSFSEDGLTLACFGYLESGEQRITIIDVEE